jgi:hypothetical protein
MRWGWGEEKAWWAGAGGRGQPTSRSHEGPKATTVQPRRRRRRWSHTPRRQGPGDGRQRLPITFETVAAVEGRSAPVTVQTKRPPTARFGRLGYGNTSRLEPFHCANAGARRVPLGACAFRGSNGEGRFSSTAATAAAAAAAAAATTAGGAANKTGDVEKKRGDWRFVTGHL